MLTMDLSLNRIHTCMIYKFDVAKLNKNQQNQY